MASLGHDGARGNETARTAIRAGKPFLPRALATSEIGMSRLATRMTKAVSRL